MLCIEIESTIHHVCLIIFHLSSLNIFYLVRRELVEQRIRFYSLQQTTWTFLSTIRGKPYITLFICRREYQCICNVERKILTKIQSDRNRSLIFKNLFFEQFSSIEPLSADLLDAYDNEYARLLQLYHQRQPVLKCIQEMVRFLEWLSNIYCSSSMQCWDWITSTKEISK